MHIKQLSTEEVTHVFNNSMQFDFPQNEIRPLSSIKSLWKKFVPLFRFLCRRYFKSICSFLQHT